jgi:hypothetical protein
MAADEGQSTGKFNISIGKVDRSQVVIGDYATVSQTVGLSAAETAELRNVFEGLRSTVAEQAPADKREAALSEAAELEAAIVTDRPQPDRVRQALTWFKKNAPQLAGAVLSVVVNPLVGKIAEGAGQAIADQFRDLAKEEG